MGDALASTSAATSPTCSPCKIEALRCVIFRTMEIGPLTAAVIDLESLNELVAGTMDPSEAQSELSFVDEEGGKLHVRERAMR